MFCRHPTNFDTLLQEECKSQGKFNDTIFICEKVGEPQGLMSTYEHPL